MKNFLLLSFLWAGIFISKNVSASHIIGGEISYTCLGNDNYQIVVKIYRDCYNGIPPLDNPAYFAIYDVNNSLILNPAIALATDSLIPLVSPSPCIAVPTNVCVEEGTYVFQANLPANPGGYTIVYQRCCRNNSISNLFDPGNTGATYVGTIPDPSIASCNTSPIFVNYPPVVICVGEPLSFDHSAYDADGDSLVYALCTPYIGADAVNSQPTIPSPPPYTNVTYQGTYSSGNPMGGNPALAIDPQTGLLTVTPDQTGQFVVGICVSEYRNGQLIETHLRDFQFNVVQCQATVVASIPDVFNDCGGLTFNFPNYSIGGNNYHWDFGVSGTNADTSNLFSPSFTFPDTGVYTVTLIVNPGSQCGDTATATVYAYPTISGNFSFTDGCVNVPVDFTDISSATYGNADSWNWDFGDGGTSSSQNPSHIYSDTGTYNVTLIVSTDLGCVDTVTLSIYVNLSSSVFAGPDVTICPGDTTQLSASGAISYQWSPASVLSDPNAQNPLAFPTETTDYIVTGFDSIGCPAKDTTVVTVYSSAHNICPDTTIILGTNAYLCVSGGVSYSWVPSGGMDDPTSTNPIVSPTETTTYYVTIITSEGCVLIDSIVVTVVDEPIVVVPNAFSPNGDGQNDIFRPIVLGLLSLDYFRIYNRWGQLIYEGKDISTAGWNGIYQGEPQEVGVYVYTLSGHGTATGTPVLMQGNVTLVR